MKSLTAVEKARGKQCATVLFVGALGFVSLTAAYACELKITWKAALVSSLKGGGPAAGTAAIDFDPARPSATMRVDTRGLQDVRAIEMHVTRSYADRVGPAVLTLYSATGDGPLPATLTRHVGETDLRKQASPRVAGFGDLVGAVLNGRAYVVVTTKAHPEGEFSGFIRMHKEEIYSDSPTDGTHDAVLHHAHPSVSPTPSTP